MYYYLFLGETIILYRIGNPVFLDWFIQSPFIWVVQQVFERRIAHITPVSIHCAHMRRDSI